MEILQYLYSVQFSYNSKKKQHKKIVINNYILISNNKHKIILFKDAVVNIIVY